MLGRKRMMILGALFFAAPPFLYPFIANPWALLALRLVHGFATAISHYPNPPGGRNQRSRKTVLNEHPQDRPAGPVRGVLVAHSISGLLDR